MSSQYQIPSTPRVISPSPTPSETTGRDGYFPPQTRSMAASARKRSVDTIDEHHEEDPELDRARSRNRISQQERKPTHQMKMTQMNGSITSQAKAGMPSAAAGGTATRRKKEVDKIRPPNGHTDPNGFLSPASAYPQGYGAAYWRNLSRSPSPLGLIPIHREWRAFVHKHEVPRKALHVSIGFVALYFYLGGMQPTDIHPILLGLLIPILSIDLIRFKWPAFNRLYIKVVGAFMRESEAHDRFNGVISYLAGLWFTMRFCRKDVGIISVLLLSWCDTAASTFGRLLGKYTPRVRRGKSLAGSLAAFVFGVGTAVLFWGWIAPNAKGTHDKGVNSFAYTGHLVLPSQVRGALNMRASESQISGELALAVLAVVSGLVASISEAIDLWDLDDNLTIPVLCGIGLGAFLWAFGGS